MNKVTVLDRLQFYYNASKMQDTLRGLPLFEPIKFLFFIRAILRKLLNRDFYDKIN